MQCLIIILWVGRQQGSCGVVTIPLQTSTSQGEAGLFFMYFQICPIRVTFPFAAKDLVCVSVCVCAVCDH